MRASFLPGPRRSVEQMLEQASFDEIDLTGYSIAAVDGVNATLGFEQAPEAA